MAADQLAIELSADQERPIPFANSGWNYLNDQSGGGNYSSGQSTLDTSSLANNAGYLDPKSLTLAVPGSIRTKASAASAISSSPFMLALKNWYGQLIHYFTADLNSTNIIQQTPFLNVFQHFKLMSTLSWDDIRKDGSLMGFYPDSSTSWDIVTVQDTATPSNYTKGYGIVNNSDYVPQSATVLNTVAAGYRPVGGNEGMLKRQQWICYDGVTAASGITNTRLYAASAAQLQQVLKSNISTTSTTEIIYRFVAIIPLYQLNHLFAELPLMKGAFFRFQLQFNQVNLSYTAAASGGAGLPGMLVVAGDAWPTVTVSNPFGGGTNPVMLADRASGNGSYAIDGAAGDTYTTELRIGTTAWSDGTANAGPGMQQVRLYYRMVTMSPADEAAYAASAVHRVRYRDLYQYTLSNVTSGSNPTQLLWNAVARPRELLMVPVAASQTIGTLTNPNGLLTPFDSSPATTCPMAHITNFQVNLSGTAIFPIPISYGFTEFLQELRKTGVNYGQTPGLSSGLIGFEDFMNNYAYVYVNLDGYCLPSMDDIAKSISVSFTSQSGLTTDWLCFCSHERELELNVLSGQIISYK